MIKKWPNDDTADHATATRTITVDRSRELYLFNTWTYDSRRRSCCLQTVDSSVRLGYPDNSSTMSTTRTTMIPKDDHGPARLEIIEDVFLHL
jgi:hypothetical protein